MVASEKESSRTGNEFLKPGMKLKLKKEPKVRNGAGENATAGNGGQGHYSRSSVAHSDADGFMDIPDGIDDKLPFS